MMTESDTPQEAAGAGSSPSSYSPCECQDWCREGQMFLTTHHPRCSKYSPEDDAYKIIVGLLRGIEVWAQDEDGVHPACWEAYKTAKAAVWEAHLVRCESDE